GWYRLLYSLFAGANFALLFWFHSITPSKLMFTINFPIQFSGAVFGIGSFIVVILALRQYEWQFWITKKRESGNKLVTSGLNKHVRHPLYFAVILGLVSLVLLAPRWKNLIFSIITMLYIIIGALLEERKLINT